MENPCTFLLVKEKTWNHIFNTNNELSQNCTENQIMLFKTTVNCLFNNICYLVIGCFDWKIGVFQQTVALVYCILKLFSNSWGNWCAEVTILDIKYYFTSGKINTINKRNTINSTNITSLIADPLFILHVVSCISKRYWMSSILVYSPSQLQTSKNCHVIIDFWNNATKYRRIYLKI